MVHAQHVFELAFQLDGVVDPASGDRNALPLRECGEVIGGPLGQIVRPERDVVGLVAF
jgi:hypothetical protein